MVTRKTFAYILGFLLLLALGRGEALPPVGPDSAKTTPPSQDIQPPGQPAVHQDAPGAPPPNVAGPPATSSSDKPPVEPPDDPCLPPLYKDWREFGADARPESVRASFAHVRVVIDRSTFELVVQGIGRDDSTQELYRTPVALGDLNSPTPAGQFLLNHIYCYPDVVFFDSVSAEKVPNLYRGFFAPMLLCDEAGRCERFRDLGIHGFDASAHPRPEGIVPATYGAVSGGCIRVPDPCKLKSELIRAVGVGPIKKNERGCYHWLNKPVEVVVTGYYPGTEPLTIVSILEAGLHQVQSRLKGIFDVFLP